MLAFEDIEGYLKYYAARLQDSRTEFWELVSEAWLRIHELNEIKFACQGIRWAIANYKSEQRSLTHRRNRGSRFVPLYEGIEFCGGGIDVDYLVWFFGDLAPDEFGIVMYRLKGFNLREIAGFYGLSYERIRQKSRLLESKLREKL